MSEHFDAKLWGRSKRESLDELLSKCRPEKRHAEIPFSSPEQSAKVKVKRLYDSAVIPTKAHASDAGFDLVAVEDWVIDPGETALIKTGIAVELPPGYVMDIRPRSGITLRTKLRVQYGTIDAGYRSEVGVILDNTARIEMDVDYYSLYECDSVWGAYEIRKGDRIAQAVIQRLPAVELVEVESLGESDRGVGGFGSTGVK